MIGFDHVSFSYRAPAAANRAGVEDVSLSVGSGEVVVLCGRSGCGKSTLLRLAGGLAPRFFPGEVLGSVLLDGGGRGRTHHVGDRPEGGLSLPEPTHPVQIGRAHV